MKVCLSSVLISVTISTDWASAFIKTLLSAGHLKRCRTQTHQWGHNYHASTLPSPSVSHFPAHIHVSRHVERLLTKSVCLFSPPCLLIRHFFTCMPFHVSLAVFSLLTRTQLRTDAVEWTGSCSQLLLPCPFALWRREMITFAVFFAALVDHVLSSSQWNKGDI